MHCVTNDGKIDRASAALQIRVPIPEVAVLIRSLIDGHSTWADATAKYPAQKTPDDE